MTKMTSQASERKPIPAAGLQWWQISRLERQGCSASSWEEVSVHPDTDLSLIRDVEFIGHNSVGLLDESVYPGCRLQNLTAEDCES